MTTKTERNLQSFPASNRRRPSFLSPSKVNAKEAAAERRIAVVDDDIDVALHWKRHSTFEGNWNLDRGSSYFSK